MNIPYKEYILTQTVQEALRILSVSQGSAYIVAGGSDLLLEIEQGTVPPVHTLVDVSEIEEMCALEYREGSLFIGASITLTRLKCSALVKQHAQALMDAAALMANPQVCNVATIGGNVAHALPAADGTIALLALDAQAEVANSIGRRRVPLQALFQGPGKSTLDPCGDILLGFYLPLKRRGQASSFVRRVNPQGIALAMLNVGIWLQQKDGCVEDIRIAVGPSGPVPGRMYTTERVMRGKQPSPELQAMALDALLSEAHFRSSLHRASADYRRHLAGMLLDEALMTAWQRAGS